MEKHDLQYTILQDLHDKADVSFNDMLDFYCTKLMEHFKWESERKTVINGQKLTIKVEIEED